MISKYSGSKNYLLKNWYLGKKIVSFLKSILDMGFKNIQIVSGFEIEIEISAKYLYPLIVFLNKHTICQYKILTDMICSDTLGKVERFEVTYSLLSICYNSRLRVTCKLSEVEMLLSVVSLYRSANWLEREVFDFYGIYFLCNKDLRRILNDYGFKGFPLRKDFPLTGYIDTYYDDNQKRICYKSLELAQEYRSFNFKKNWS